MGRCEIFDDVTGYSITVRTPSEQCLYDISGGRILWLHEETNEHHDYHMVVHGRYFVRDMTIVHWKGVFRKDHLGLFYGSNFKARLIAAPRGNMSLEDFERIVNDNYDAILILSLL